MGTTVTFLLSIGLCLHWVMGAQTATLPRPTLWAVPSPVVPSGADVTLRCQGRLESDRFQLWKDGELREERHASWQLAEFVLRNVDGVRDARSYSCRSGQGPWWSELSEPLTLVVTGAFPKPSISASSGSIVSLGKTVTIVCHMSPQAPSQDYTFALLEAKSLEPLQLQSPAGTRADFSLPSVRAEDSGSYSCIYYRKTAPHRASHPSQALELSVPGLLPKPTLWAQPGLVMVPGSNITLWCSRPKLPSLEEVTFTLWETRTQEPLQRQSSAEPWTSFPLPSLRPRDAGSYSCTYKDRRSSARRSKTSEALKLVVTGSLPKPSLSALPGLVVDPGTHVILQCRQPPQSSLWGVTFTLMKEGTPQTLQSQSPAGMSADFPLLSVRAQDSGNYSCVYHKRMAPSQVSEPSEVLEIWVTGNDSKALAVDRRHRRRDNRDFVTVFSTRPMETNGTVPSNTLLITFSCVSFLLLLLCLLLLALLCRGSIPMGSLQGDSPSRCLCCSCLPSSTSLPPQPEACRKETLYAEVAKERSRELMVPMAEDPQGVTYAQLNINTSNERKTDPTQTATESALYATVSRD